MLRFDPTGFREHRLLYRMASDFGYTDPNQAKVDTRDLSRQVQTQQQSNLDAQRAQQAQVAMLNTEEQRKAATDPTYIPVNYSRTAATADKGIPITGMQLGADGNPIDLNPESGKSGFTVNGSNVIPDRSLPTSNVGQANDLGQIDQSALQRLMGTGMSYDEALRTIQGNRTNVQQSFNQVGTGYSPTAIQRQMDRAKQMDVLRNANPASVAADIQNKTGLTELMKQDELDRQTEHSKANDAARSSTAADLANGGGSPNLFANLPPEAAGLAPFFQNILDTITQGQNDQAAATEALLNGGTIDVNGNPVNVQGINSLYDDMDKKIQGLEDGYVAMQDGIQGMLDKAKEQQDKYISEQEEAAKQRMAWQETQMLRQAANEKQDAVDSRIARLALTGGFGSDGGLREIEETRASYEARMDDIKTEMGVQRTELAAKFTGLYLEASNAHLTASISNIRETSAALERIAGQSMASKQARASAEQGVVTKFVDSQVAARKEYAGTLKEYGQQMVQMIYQEKEFKRQDEAQAWDQFKWLKTTFGTNIPDGALNSIKSKLPGVDVMALAQAQTADEIEKARKGSGGGGSGLSFNFSQMQSTGEPPSFDSFLKQKESEALASGATKFDSSPAAMAKYRAEYDARLKGTQQFNPETIAMRLDDRTRNSAKHIRENAVAKVEALLKQGKFAEASSFVDGIGTPVTGGERGDYIQARNAKRNVARIAALIEDFGAMGPVAGRMRMINPWDDQTKELKSLITQTVPGLARGIFKEVGVLTDTDIANYTSTMANPLLTLDQARTATKNLLETIDISIESQLAVHDAAGLNIRDIRTLFSEGNNDPELIQEIQPQVSQYLSTLGY